MQLIDSDLPNHDVASTLKALGIDGPDHAPRILLLYGSLRERSFSRFLVEEAARVLDAFGAETR
ncbi:MAG: arsenic resistance protein ArsH, partial [Myxococcota bacterium]